MDIMQIRELKKRMERKVLEALQDAMAEFHDSTGLKIQEVQIEAVTVHSIGQIVGRKGVRGVSFTVVL